MIPTVPFSEYAAPFGSQSLVWSDVWIDGDNTASHNVLLARRSLMSSALENVGNAGETRVPLTELFTFLKSV